MIPSTLGQTHSRRYVWWMFAEGGKKRKQEESDGERATSKGLAIGRE